jgi:predicted transcriptional regulator
MKEYKFTGSEEKFADLIWQYEPIGSGDLVKLCEKEMNWKKSTTYTVLKKLCEN